MFPAVSVKLLMIKIVIFSLRKNKTKKQATYSGKGSGASVSDGHSLNLPGQCTSLVQFCIF